ncbi:MAG: fructosamine kinase family protein [Coraliomargarita sp.]
MNKPLEAFLSEQIGRATGQAFDLQSVRACSGGCINQTYILEGCSQKYFVKLNEISALDMFKAEALALRELESTATIRVPNSITQGRCGEQSYLVLETLNLGSAATKSWAEMGKQLATLHRHTRSEFGWTRNNFIGSNPQSNTSSESWADFFTQHRIEFQLKLAEQRGMQFERVNALIDRIHAELEQHSCRPSLLHGDLWSGNVGFVEDGEPVIFDPACYYGDREADLAFTEFFGGFSGHFYRSYQEAWPLPEGYSQRKQIYNLYHVLNHANLFGGSYQLQAQGMIHEILV